MRPSHASTSSSWTGVARGAYGSVGSVARGVFATSRMFHQRLRTQRLASRGCGLVGEKWRVHGTWTRARVVASDAEFHALEVFNNVPGTLRRIADVSEWSGDKCAGGGVVQLSGSGEAPLGEKYL
jgi:hypothetical protein